MQTKLNFSSDSHLLMAVSILAKEGSPCWIIQTFGSSRNASKYPWYTEPAFLCLLLCSPWSKLLGPVQALKFSAEPPQIMSAYLFSYPKLKVDFLDVDNC